MLPDRLLSHLLAAPGVVVHEFAHKLACDLANVPVIETVYFQFGDPPGYVRHHQPSAYRTSFLISIAPFFVNTIVALLASFWFWVLLSTLGSLHAPVELLEGLVAAEPPTQAGVFVLGWLGLSIGQHAFPSNGDAATLWDRTRAEWRSTPLVLVGLPFVALIYLSNLLSWAYADLWYAVGLWTGAFVLVAGVP